MTTTHLRTAGIWIEEGHVLLESLASRDVWGIPGGGLEPDETAEAGCVREYLEETGIVMRVFGLALLHENFWRDGSTDRREYGFYFRVRPEDPSLHGRVPVVSCEPRLKFGWFRLDEVGTLDFVPFAMRSLLPELGEQTRFVSTLEASP